jgi:hypothetical protein
MQDRPTAVELIEAVRDFLAGEVAPALADRSLRYRMRIALHVRASWRASAGEETAPRRAQERC